MESFNRLIEIRNELKSSTYKNRSSIKWLKGIINEIDLLAQVIQVSTKEVTSFLDLKYLERDKDILSHHENPKTGFDNCIIDLVDDLDSFIDGYSGYII